MQLRAKLKQIIHFKANGRTKFDKKDISTAIGPQMATNEYNPLVSIEWIECYYERIQ